MASELWPRWPVERLRTPFHRGLCRGEAGDPKGTMSIRAHPSASVRNRPPYGKDYFYGVGRRSNAPRSAGNADFGRKCALVQFRPVYGKNLLAAVCRGAATLRPGNVSFNACFIAYACQTMGCGDFLHAPSLANARLCTSIHSHCFDFGGGNVGARLRVRGGRLRGRRRGRWVKKAGKSRLDRERGRKVVYARC
jgi:hypothetical protein